MAAPRTAIAALCKKLLPETSDRAAYIHWHQVGFDSIAKLNASSRFICHAPEV